MAPKARSTRKKNEIHCILLEFAIIGLIEVMKEKIVLILD
jgi:hypothetical protein